MGFGHTGKIITRLETEELEMKKNGEEEYQNEKKR